MEKVNLLIKQKNIGILKAGVWKIISEEHTKLLRSGKKISKTLVELHNLICYLESME